MLIQIGTNLTNDYYDFRKGADTHERVGPTRVTQSGLIAPQTVLAAGAACFALAVVVGHLPRGPRWAGPSWSSAWPRSSPAGPTPGDRTRSGTTGWETSS